MSIGIAKNPPKRKTVTKHLKVICLSLLLGITYSVSEEVDGKVTFKIAKDKKSFASIVISQKAGEIVKLAANKLENYLEQITGATFKVTFGNGEAGIIVGTPEQFPSVDSEEIKDSLKIVNSFDGKEAFVIRSERKRLLLIGATELGASHAVFRFLEKLGCRWFFPGKKWEVIPKIPSLSVCISLSDRPAFLARRIWYQWGFFDRNIGRCEADYKAWARHNLMGQSLKIHCGHSWQAIIARYRDEFRKHPEYLALRISKDKKTGK